MYNNPFVLSPAYYYYYVTPKLFGMQSNTSSKLHELETSNLVSSFNLGNPSGNTNNFP